MRLFAICKGTVGHYYISELDIEVILMITYEARVTDLHILCVLEKHSLSFCLCGIIIDELYIFACVN